MNLNQRTESEMERIDRLISAGANITVSSTGSFLESDDSRPEVS